MSCAFFLALKTAFGYNFFMNMQRVEKYKQIIRDIINSDVKFFGFDNSVEWEFFEDSSIANAEKTDSSFKLYININSVEFAYEIDQPLQIELFILHEIRHIYQRRFLLSYKTGADCPNPELAQVYEWEFNHYVPPSYKEGYYSQQTEFEAFAFSHAVMLYKYGEIHYLEPPSFLKSLGIQNHIDKWLDIFRQRRL